MSLFKNVQTAHHLQNREDLKNVQDDWLIDKLLMVGNAGILVAPMKSMKSSLTMQMAIDVSNGTDFFGYKTKKSNVLLIDNEDTDRELNKRLRAKDNAPDNLHFLTGGKFSLDSIQDMRDMIKYIKENDIGFVILDNLMTMFPKSKMYEDSFQEMLERIRLAKLDLQNTTFLLIAHANKSTYAQSMREDKYEVSPADALGGSELSAWAEFMLVLSPKKGKKNKYSKLTVEARGYPFEDQLNFAYVADEFVCRKSGEKEKPLYVKEEEKKQGVELTEKNIEVLGKEERTNGDDNSF